MDRGRITLYIAASVDGYVADADGGVEWLEEIGEAADGDDFGYEAFLADVDCLAMGSKTYEQVLSFGEWPYGKLPTYVFTTRDLPRAAESVEFVEGDVAEVADDLTGRYDRVWLVGGARLVQAFLREGKLDALRLFVAPILLGNGVRLFDGDGERRRLRLVGAEAHGAGMVELRYER